MRVTQYDVAKLAGVSHSTVSRVINDNPLINEETRKKVLEAIRELNYIPNESARRFRSLQSGKETVRRTYNIGCLLFPSNTKYSHPFYSEIQYGIETEMIKNKYHLQFKYEKDKIVNDPTVVINEINHENIDGIILIWVKSLWPQDIEFCEEIRKRVRNIISLGTVISNEIDSILPDEEGGTYEAMKYLAGLGHRRIGFMGNDYGPLIEGYRKAVKDFNLDNNRTFISDLGVGYDIGRKAMGKIFEEARPLPTAIFCSNDLTAMGTMDLIKEKGLKIPDNISIIGCDDINEAQHLNPPLTTIRIEKEKLGKLTTEMLIKRIEDPDMLPVKITVPVKLIIRESCRSIKSEGKE